MANKVKQAIEILKNTQDIPCGETDCDCENCTDELCNEKGVNTCMYYGIVKALEILE